MLLCSVVSGLFLFLLYDLSMWLYMVSDLQFCKLQWERHTKIRFGDTMANKDKQQQTTNKTTNKDNRWTRTNHKQNCFLNAYYESWPPWYLDHLDYSDQLNHPDNPDWSMINQKDNRKIRIVYLVLSYQLILQICKESETEPNFKLKYFLWNYWITIKLGQ